MDTYPRTISLLMGLVVGKKAVDLDEERALDQEPPFPVDGKMSVTVKAYPSMAMAQEKTKVWALAVDMETAMETVTASAVEEGTALGQA